MGDHEYDYDLLVIGSGPGGQKAAIAAAKLGRRAAIVERRHMVGGVCLNTGTIPSKTLREAVFYLTGLNLRELYGRDYRVKDDITVQDLLARTQHVIGREIEIVRSQLSRNGVDLIAGTARFVDPHTVVVDTSHNERTASGRHVVIATGTVPARPQEIAFDGVRILDSDGILTLGDIPRTMVVVGAGVIGIEYASMFAALGTKVTVVECRDRIVPGKIHGGHGIGTLRGAARITPEPTMDVVSEVMIRSPSSLLAGPRSVSGRRTRELIAYGQNTGPR